MKLPARYLLSKACANKKEREDRPAYGAAYVRRWDEKAVIVASNGVLCVAVTLSDGTLEEDDQPGAIPVEALAAAEKNRTAEYIPELTLGAGDVVVKLSEEETLLVHRNPDLGPDLDGLIRGAERLSEVASVGIDVDLLRRLAHAMGTEKVRLSIRGQNAVVVTPWGDEKPDARGMLATLKE